MDMGGYHVTIRRATGNYIGVNSRLKLPDRCMSVPDRGPSQYDGILPEFVHGFYKGAYGFDAGLMYNRYGDGRWHLFHGALANTLEAGSWVQSSAGFALSMGTSIWLASYLDRASETLVTRVQSAAGITIVTLKSKLTTEAFAAMKHGCDITRELLMATNRSSNVIPADAVFEFAKFYNGTLTTVDGAYVPFTKGAEPARADANAGFDSSRIHTLCIEEVYSGVVYGCEVGSCSFQNKVAWEHPF